MTPLLHLIAVIRREAKRLAAIAAIAAENENVRAVPSFRPLTDAETEAIVGRKLLTKPVRFGGPRLV